VIDSITPPPELVQQWATVNGTHYEDLATLCWQVAIQAAQWGADQELAACCEWIKSELRGQLRPAHRIAIDLRDARRPEPPSLKEQALELVDSIGKAESMWTMSDLETIRRALEALPE
jgi:hypothetical protein